MTGFFKDFKTRKLPPSSCFKVDISFMNEAFNISKIYEKIRKCFFYFMSNLTQTKQKNKIESKECVRTVLNNKKEIYTKD